MKILMISPIAHDSCSFYRSGGIATDLRDKLGIDIDVTSWQKEQFTWQTLLKYNLIMMQRPYTKTALEMAVYAKGMGIPLWVDYDDYLLDVPDGNRAYDTMMAARPVIKNMLMIADAVSVTTSTLKELFSEFNENIHIIPNAFNDINLPARRLPVVRDDLIAWRGSETHIIDIYPFRETIAHIIEKYPSWNFVFMGYSPSWMIGSYPNLGYIPTVDPGHYFEYIKKIAAHTFHVPLASSLFNKAKSNIALIEASYAGSLCICPSWDGWEIPGALNYTDDKHYRLLLEKCIRGEIDVDLYNDMAWEYITDVLMLSKVNQLRVDLVKSLLK